MSQTSVTQYFASRKRPAVDDLKLTKARKALKLDNQTETSLLAPAQITNKQVLRKIRKTRDIKNFLENCNKLQDQSRNTNEDKSKKELCQKISANSQVKASVTRFKELDQQLVTLNEKQEEGTNKIIPKQKKDAELDSLKKKLVANSRVLACMSQFKTLDKQLQAVQNKKESIIQKQLKDEKPLTPTKLKLDNFKSIEIEVPISPQKVFSPEKSYLSPKAAPSPRKLFLSPQKSQARRILFSPKKESKVALFQDFEEPPTSSLTLPYKYRYLEEIFRNVDTICNIMQNRKETITFRKLKASVEELMKRNFYEKYLSQIKKVFPDAFVYQLRKLKVFGQGNKMQWELVIQINDVSDHLSPECLIKRRMKLRNALLNQLKAYHGEFLSTLNPPINVDPTKIKRWHPEFDLEKVPDIEESPLPQIPVEDSIVTGKEVLERAKMIFTGNKRLETALENLQTQESTNSNQSTPLQESNSVLKGIPKGLLEKVRQRQAVKALESVTRSDEKEKQINTYSHLPEIVKLTRNLFVTEKKSVLPLEIILDKLNNSTRATVVKSNIDEYLKLLAKDVPTWITYLKIRNTTYVKIAKDMDMSLVLNKLECKLKALKET